MLFSILRGSPAMISDDGSPGQSYSSEPVIDFPEIENKEVLDRTRDNLILEREFTILSDLSLAGKI